MKTIIAGSRKIVNYNYVIEALRLAKNKGIFPSEIVSGKARGIDTLGEKWARENNLPIIKFPANWEKYGKSAGYKRNRQMANYSDALIAIWNEESKGTKHMINLARKYKLKFLIYNINKLNINNLEEFF